VGDETNARRNEMRIAMSNALALMRWHDFRFLQNFSNRDLAWLLIGALLGGLAIWAFSRRRRRLF
jgi:LPXTG-motif cell wall-anchored protein